LVFGACTLKKKESSRKGRDLRKKGEGKAAHKTQGKRVQKKALLLLHRREGGVVREEERKKPDLEKRCEVRLVGETFSCLSWKRKRRGTPE